MTDPTAGSTGGSPRLDFDRRLMLRFRSAVITPDAGLLVYRELVDGLGLTDAGGDVLAEARTGKNGRYALIALLRQSMAQSNSFSAVYNKSRIKGLASI